MEDVKSRNLVSPEQHLAVLEFVEGRVKAELDRIQQPGWHILGTQVSYRAPEDVSTEYSLERGDVSELACAYEEEVDEKQWQEIVEANRDHNPLPIEFVDDLYQEVKVMLSQSAGRQLLVWVGGVLTSNPTVCYGSGCKCSAGTKRRYCYKTASGDCSCYCPGTSC